MKTLVSPFKWSWIHFFAGALLVSIIFEIIALGFPTASIKGIVYTLNWPILKVTSMLVLAIIVSDKIAKQKPKKRK